MKHLAASIFYFLIAPLPIWATGIAENVLPPSKIVRRELPAWLRDKLYLMENWQWLAILLVIVFGHLFGRLLIAFIHRWIDRYFAKINYQTDPKNIKQVLSAIGFIIMAGFAFVMIQWLNLPKQVFQVLTSIIEFMVLVFSVWTFYRGVDVICSHLKIKASKTDSKFDDMMIPLFSKSLKVVVIIFGCIFVLQNLNVDVMGIVAGLGIGGIAIAFAAKETIANFFGSLTVLTDRPFQTGDWIIINGMEGTVEEIGFRSTKLRTFSNSLITIPNSLLVTSPVDNMGLREYRRFKTMLSLTYNTPPDKIQAFCNGIKQLIIANPNIRQDNYNVYFNQFAESSLDVLVYIFFKVPDWATELKEREQFMLNILNLAKELGIEFAYPTRTVVMEKE